MVKWLWGKGNYFFNAVLLIKIKNGQPDQERPFFENEKICLQS